MTDLKIHAHKIFYDTATRAAIAPPYIPLDNTENPPFWFEMWPILRFLEQADTLDDAAVYGFFSTKFPRKVGMSDDAVLQLVRDNPHGEVFLFSYNWPGLIMGRNVWVQGEYHHPGLIDCSEDFLATCGPRPDLRGAITDLSSGVFSNYILARPRFWRAWQKLARAYCDYVENGGPDLPDCRPASHRTGDSIYQVRTFVQERLACWLLLQGDYAVVHPDYIRTLPIYTADPAKTYGLLRQTLRASNTFKLRWKQSGRSTDRLLHKACNRISRALLPPFEDAAG